MYSFIAYWDDICPGSPFGQLTVSGEFRPQAEVRIGYKNLNTDKKLPAYLITQRTRVGLQFQHDWIKTSVSFQDARIWGDETNYSGTGVYGDAASVEINEAWIQMDMSSHSSLKIGRQYFDYDDGRLLSTRNWNVQALKYDAILYQYVREKLTFDAAISYNNQADNTFGNLYSSNKMKTMNFIHAGYKFNDHLKGALIAIASGFTKNDTSEIIYMKGTYGAIVDYQKDALTVMANIYLQNGKTKKGIDASAYNFNAKADYNLGIFAVGAGVTLVSGDDAADKTSDNMFDMLYGNTHSYYGLMDLFSSMQATTGNGGLNDYFLNLKYKPNDKLSLQADYHLFTLNTDVVSVIDTEGNPSYYDKGLGSEVDLHFKWKMHKIMELNGGYSFMLPGSTMFRIQHISENDEAMSSWAWLQLVVKPVFFSNK